MGTEVNGSCEAIGGSRRGSRLRVEPVARPGQGYLCWDGESDAVLSGYLAVCWQRGAPVVLVHDAAEQTNVVADFAHLSVHALLADELRDPPALQTGWRYLMRALPAIDPAWDDEGAWTVQPFEQGVQISTARRELAHALAGELYQRLRLLDGWVREYGEIIQA